EGAGRRRLDARYRRIAGRSVPHGEGARPAPRLLRGRRCLHREARTRLPAAASPSDQLTPRTNARSCGTMTGLLEGVTVVETGVLMTVDYLGRLLGDEGADVVKVETPQLGDYLRNIMTRFAPDWSAFHLILNRNKRSLTCDARTAEGRAILTKLLGDADVFRTGHVG